MIYPIIAYGLPILKEKAKDIEKGSLDVVQLSQDMFETMYYAQGVGLAAPQIGMALRIFVIDAGPMEEDETEKTNEPFKKVFINPEMLEEEGMEWSFEEGCLSIPGIREEIVRNEKIHLRYFDENWILHEETFDGIRARIIQHEYDHLEGILFTDKLSPFKKRLLKSKLNNIIKGSVKVDYRMKFAVRK
ncbi:MAG: peptide deformylase [Candidatus Cyclobacteriaceae bacterium M3_2C_046]